MRAALITAILSFVLIHQARSQSCPQSSPDGALIESSPQTLSGKIIFHNDLRQWFELRLETPVCGETVVELVANYKRISLVRTIQMLRGCRAIVSGTLGLPGTGYYSAELYEMVEAVKPDSGCVRQLPFPDYSKLKPSRSLRSYRVSIWFDYTTPDSPLHVSVRDGNRSISPWQPYASYWLTGDFQFYANCASGFGVTHFNGTPEAKPGITDNTISLDPETAALKHVNRIRLDFTCRRSSGSADNASQ
jgi:hypothetical protein